MNHNLRVGTLNALNSTYKAEERYSALYKEINELNLDVLNLQEANHIFSAELIARISQECGFKYYGKTVDLVDPSELQKASSNFIFSKHEAKFTQLDLNSNSPYDQLALLGEISYEGNTIFIINVHLAWGGSAEHARLNQIYNINSLADELLTNNPDALILAVGDYNATPQSASIGYMKGSTVYKESSSFWVDCWDYLGDASNEVTSESSSILSEQTASGVKILDASKLPKRRIDYIMVKDWIYGKSGAPVSFGRWADKDIAENLKISDHYGLYADFLFYN